MSPILFEGRYLPPDLSNYEWEPVLVKKNLYRLFRFYMAALKAFNSKIRQEILNRYRTYGRKIYKGDCVVHVVPYVRVQVSTAQLGVACLLGLRLLVCTIDMRRKWLYEHAVGVEYLVWQNTLFPPAEMSS